jgi:hypothetical protein
MFLTNLGAVIAITGSVLVLGTMAMAGLLRVLARPKERPASAALTMTTYRVLRRQPGTEKIAGGDPWSSGGISSLTRDSGR